MKDENYNIDIKITAKFKVNSAIDKKTLDSEFDGDLKHYVVSCLLEDENLFGVVEDDYVVTNVKEVDD